MNKDIIFRQDAIDALNNAVCDECIMLCNEPYSKKCCNIDYYSRGVRIIEKVPSAQLERKKGKWKKGGEQPYFRKHFDIVVCSICNKRGELRWDFCPYCGADMRGDNNEIN